MLTCESNSLKRPSMIGPLFVHVKKDFAAYHFFASSLVSRRPDLQQLKCFGSDGEAALINAFSAVFSGAIHLRCFLHFRENIEHKLRELQISPGVMKEFTKDIFGNPSKLERGLVDAKNEGELHSMLNELEQRWNDIEQQFSSPPMFHSWFVQHCFDVVLNSMSWFVREKARLGSPPQPFYTNAVESKNNVLKQHLERKSSSLPEFVDKMKSLITEQFQEAVASCGEYRIASRYSHLAYDRQKWFKMSVKQRENKVTKFMKFTLSPNNYEDNPLCELNLPAHLASTVWSRANSLVNDTSAIVIAPGDNTAFIVKSNTGQQPHYVKPSKAGGFICDDKCLGYKSAKICSHAVACALKKMI